MNEKTKRKCPAAFEKNKGRIAELATPDSYSKAGKASGEARRKKNAMRAALELIMQTPADERTADRIKSQFPQLENEIIDGYIEVAALLRSHGRKNYQATIKMAELMGGSMTDETQDKSRVVNIVVASAEDAKELAGI